MPNAKAELLTLIEDNGGMSNVEAFEIEVDTGGREVSVVWRADGAQSFVAATAAVDVEYDNGFGVQELYGTVWFKDGTWAEREEYDGSEWWDIKVRPALPVS